MKRIRAFSLFELLVVITVISLLVAFLVPAISLVRSSAVKISCTNNLRQIGLSWAAYQNTYEGFLPVMLQSMIDPGVVENYTWVSQLNSELDDEQASRVASYDQFTYWEVVRSNSIFNCPAKRLPFSGWPINTTPAPYVSYGIVRYGIGGDTVGTIIPCVRLFAGISKPSEKFVFADTVTPENGFYYCAPVSPGFCDFSRHRGVSNFMMADLRVVNLSEAESIGKYLPGNLWYTQGPWQPN